MGGFSMTEKVLLVDDEKDFLETLAERMRNRGMAVDTSSSAMDALKKIDTESYDAIILDLKMPGMDGLEALKLVKERRPELQVILLTGFGTLEKGIEAMKLGATDFVEKPADLETLTQKIKNAQAKKMILVEKQTEEKIRRIMKEKAW
jgi:DNA-binding NtrC family response regulator